MGLLDDAIREHLDLKRRRGADPGEVERAEREALGPVRRNPTPGDLPPEDDATVQDGAPAYDQAGDEGWAHDSLHEAVADAGVEPVYDEPVEPAPAPADFPDSTPFDDNHDPSAEEPYEDQSAHEPFPAAPASPQPMGGVGPETSEYNVEDALAAEDEHAQGADGEDVLEETPEFLQDTPDHDRLWFEQRPPKDFDFDE
jgi:hypothetical protein